MFHYLRRVCDTIEAACERFESDRTAGFVDEDGAPIPGKGRDTKGGSGPDPFSSGERGGERDPGADSASQGIVKKETEAEKEKEPVAERSRRRRRSYKNGQTIREEALAHVTLTAWILSGGESKGTSVKRLQTRSSRTILLETRLRPRQRKRERMAPKVVRRPAADPRRRGVLRRPAVAEEAGYWDDGTWCESQLLWQSLSVHGENHRRNQGRFRPLFDAQAHGHQFRVPPDVGIRGARAGQGTCVPSRVQPGIRWARPHTLSGGTRDWRRLHELADLPWRDVLVNAGDRGGDELAGLRGRMEDLPDPVAGGGHPGEAEGAKEKATGKEADKKKKKKKEKRKRRSSGSSDKRKKKRDRSPGSRSRGRERKKGKRKKKEEIGGEGSPVRSSASSSTSEEKGYVMVDQKTMFGRSGLDPSRKVRNRAKRKAQKYAQRKGRNKSDSRSRSSSGSEAPQKGESIFGEPHKIRAVGVSFPGVLSAAAIEDMLGSPDQRAPIGLSSSTRVVAKRHGHPLDQTRASNSSGRAQGGDPGTPARKLVVESPQGRQSGEGKRKRQEGQGQAEEGLVRSRGVGLNSPEKRRRVSSTAPDNGTGIQALMVTRPGEAGGLVVDCATI